MAPPDSPDQSDIAADLSKIGEVAKKEASRTKPTKPGRKTKEEEQLFGQQRQIRRVWHCIKIVYLIVFALAVLAALLSLFWNWFGPERMRWLNPEQLADAQKFIFSGTIGGLLTAGVNASLGKKS